MTIRDGCYRPISDVHMAFKHFSKALAAWCPRPVENSDDGSSEGRKADGFDEQRLHPARYSVSLGMVIPKRHQ